MQSRTVVGALGLIVATLLACKQGSDGGAGSSCSSDSDCKNGLLCESGACMAKAAAEKIRASSATTAPTAAPEAPLATGEAKKMVAAEGVDDGPIPAIPEGRSNPPSVSEWAQAKVVNTQGPNSWPDDCTSKVVREWLQVNCTGHVIGYEKMQSFGKSQVDYFESVKLGKMASFVVRLKKGKTMNLRICRLQNRASLFMNWPASKDRPVHIALGKGPACDGTPASGFVPAN